MQALLEATAAAAQEPKKSYLKLASKMHTRLAWLSSGNSGGEKEEGRGEGQINVSRNGLRIQTTEDRFIWQIQRREMNNIHRQPETMVRAAP